MLTESSLTGFTRIGFAARGLMYLVIGFLALRTGRTEDGSGALTYLASGSGNELLALLAVGLFAYGLWRLSEAIIDTEGHGRGLKGYGVRLGGAVSGFVHFALGFLAFKLATGSGGESGGAGMREGTAAALSLPGGEVALIAAAAAIGLTGGYQLIKAAKGDFLRHLSGQAAGRTWVNWLGRAGYSARGVVFLVMAWLFLKAAGASDASEAGGMAEALDSMPPQIQVATAVGLALFGFFSLVEARYRRITNPHVLARLQSAARTLM